MERASHVQIDPSALEVVARECGASLPDQPMPPPTQPVFEAFDDGRAMRVFAADAINFGSGYHDIVRKDPGLSGARTMHARLHRYLDATGPLDHLRLSAITPADCSQIFRQELDGGGLEELMTLFATALNDLGTFVRARGGTAQSVLEQCNHSAVGLAAALATMPFYADTQVHAGEPVAFYKRAQITPADLHREAIWTFSDLAQLTAFADNLVPHVLRVDGALEIDPNVIALIDKGDRLEPGSSPEVELRAAAVVAVEAMVAQIDRSHVWPLHVDQWLWERGGGARYKAIPRPRSRSVFY